MGQKEHLIAMAEDEVLEYSTEARKIEKLRPKFGLAVPYPQQAKVREEILADIPNNFLAKLVETQRQTVALPFWGIGGLGLLLGISASQPLDFIATVVGFAAAFNIQKWGFRLEAKRLAVKTLDAIESSIQAERQKNDP
ncbi:hypothetical protein [Baaleninema simplex]|uniref:hypothetical protein n=1 Tax=Baaleninema simplex TaxID=2862350 RepID=UPI000349C0D5|nr:hypothetical protein [Baaleninema simplex]